MQTYSPVECCEPVAAVCPQVCPQVCETVYETVQVTVPVQIGVTAQAQVGQPHVQAGYSGRVQSGSARPAFPAGASKVPAGIPIDN